MKAVDRNHQPQEASINDTTLLLEAVHFAAERHRAQHRKDKEKTPYINHPAAVAATLARDGGVDDLPTLLAALLHDTIEDTETEPDELEERFGPEVRRIVEEVSDDKSLPKHVRKLLQIEHAPHLSPQAKLVKIADLTCNVTDLALRPPLDWDTARLRAYVEWSAQVIAGCRGVHARLEACFDAACERANGVIATGAQRGEGPARP